MVCGHLCAWFSVLKGSERESVKGGVDEQIWIECLIWEILRVLGILVRLKEIWFWKGIQKKLFDFGYQNRMY